MDRGTHPLAHTLNEAQRSHYLEFLAVVRGRKINDIVWSMDRQTGMRWRGSSKSELAFYYATAKVPHKSGCTFPMAGRANLKVLTSDLDKREKQADYRR